MEGVQRLEKGGCASVVVDYVRVSREGRGLALSRIDPERVKGLKKGSLVVPICEDSFGWYPLKRVETILER